jgi:hypothetical protein
MCLTDFDFDLTCLSNDKQAVVVHGKEHKFTVFPPVFDAFPKIMKFNKAEFALCGLKGWCEKSFFWSGVKGLLFT